MSTKSRYINKGSSEIKIKPIKTGSLKGPKVYAW